MTKNGSMLLFRKGMMKASVFCLLLTAFTVVKAADVEPVSANTVAGVTIVQQNGRVTGVVRDETGEPIIGANVIIKGTATGTITDLDGNYALEGIPADATLQFSYIGYIPQEVRVGSQSTINVVLREDTQTLDEVVVTALGIKRQSRSLGYSTTQVGGDEFTMARDPNLGNALSGKIAGVSVAGNATGSGGSSRVVMHL